MTTPQTTALPHEIVVFFAAENARPPLTLAREMVESVGAGRAEIGVDALTGGTEVRFYYDPQTLETVRCLLEESGARFDLNFL